MRFGARSRDVGRAGGTRFRTKNGGYSSTSFMTERHRTTRFVWIIEIAIDTPIRDERR